MTKRRLGLKTYEVTRDVPRSVVFVDVDGRKLVYQFDGQAYRIVREKSETDLEKNLKVSLSMH